MIFSYVKRAQVYSEEGEHHCTSRREKNLTLDLKTVKNSIQAFIVCLFVIYLFSFFISCFLFSISRFLPPSIHVTHTCSHSLTFSSFFTFYRMQFFQQSSLQACVVRRFLNRQDTQQHQLILLWPGDQPMSSQHDRVVLF